MVPEYFNNKLETAGYIITGKDDTSFVLAGGGTADSSNIPFGNINATLVTTGGSLNDITKSGFYTKISTSNYPGIYNYQNVLHVAGYTNADKYGWQLSSWAQWDGLFFRTKGGGDAGMGWGSWEKILTSANIVSENKIHQVDFTGGINNGSNGRTNKSWFDYSWAGTGNLGSVINFSGLNDYYSSELFVEYSNGMKVGVRSKNGNTNVWNPVNWLWHSRNLTQGDINNWNDAFSWGDNSKMISAYTSVSVTHDFSVIVQKNQIIECQDVPSIDFIKLDNDKIEITLFNYSAGKLEVYIEGNLMGNLEPEEKVNFRFSELAGKIIFYDRNPISSSL